MGEFKILIPIYGPSSFEHATIESKLKTLYENQDIIYELLKQIYNKLNKEEVKHG